MNYLIFRYLLKWKSNITFIQSNDTSFRETVGRSTHVVLPYVSPWNNIIEYCSSLPYIYEFCRAICPYHVLQVEIYILSLITWLKYYWNINLWIDQLTNGINSLHDKCTWNFQRILWYWVSLNAFDKNRFEPCSTQENITDISAIFISPLILFRRDIKCVFEMWQRVIFKIWGVSWCVIGDIVYKNYWFF